MKMRFAKVRITDHRPPPGAAGRPPLESRQPGRPGAAAWPHDPAEAAAHDKWVAMFSRDELRKMHSDLTAQRKDGDWSKNKWIVARVHAIERRLKGGLR